MRRAPDGLEKLPEKRKSRRRRKVPKVEKSPEKKSPTSRKVAGEENTDGGGAPNSIYINKLPINRQRGRYYIVCSV